MLALGAEHLVPGHTRPITQAANVRAALMAYRDAIQSVLDQTLAGMRKGERPDELVQHVKLPPPLADNPYLQEFYGSVAWSVRAIYADRLGWFDGNATRLFPLTERQRAAKIIGLAGGADQVLARARDALAAREFQWAAELADYLLAVDGVNATRRESRVRPLRNWASGRSTPARGTITSPLPSTSCGVVHPSEPWLTRCRLTMD